jgi:hypothetical protein
MFSPLLIALRGRARRPGARTATVLTLALGIPLHHTSGADDDTVRAREG